MKRVRTVKIERFPHCMPTAAEEEYCTGFQKEKHTVPADTKLLGHEMHTNISPQWMIGTNGEEVAIVLGLPGDGMVMVGMEMRSSWVRDGDGDVLESVFDIK